MTTNDLDWDYNVYAMDSVFHNICVMASIFAGCGCLFLIRRHVIAKWLAAPVILGAWMVAFVTAHREPSFRAYVTRDLITMFASGFFGGMIGEAVQRRRKSSR